MEDLQGTLQSILSDPEQMARVAALAESLGLKPPDGPGQSEESARSAAAPLGTAGLDAAALMSRLSTFNGTEDRVLNALRPSLSPEGQGRVDRALRAAKLSRLAGEFLKSRGDGHV